MPKRKQIPTIGEFACALPANLMAKSLLLHGCHGTNSFFEVAPTIKEENIKPLIMANAPALLYGAARELILLASGYAPYGPIMLPTATFIDEAVQNNWNAKPLSGVEALLQIWFPEGR